MLGKKIDNLNLLKEKGYNIPSFEVIKWDEVIQNFDTNYIYKIKKKFNNKDLSEKLKSELKTHINLSINVNKYNDTYAVRSSCNLEDNKNLSFAGLFTTILNVKKEQLEEKITEVLLSLYDESVLEYAKKNNIDISKLKMNVIIQKQINSDLSGVIFTANPTGLLNEEVITVGKGLGENVVSDKIKTTSYYYNTTDKVYYYDGHEELLSEKNVKELIEISQKLEKNFEKYLDIEFAIEREKIFIIQVRKITTIKDSHPLILDNSNIVESYPGVSLPLTISLVNMMYSSIFKNVSRRILENEKELNKHNEVFKNMVGSYNGRIYYKISNWYTIIKFLPLNSKIIPIWQDMMGVKIKSYDRNKVKLNLLTKIRTYYNAIYELKNSQKNMQILNEKFIKINKEFYEQYHGNCANEELIKLYNKIKNQVLEMWDVTLINDMYSFIYTGLLKKELKKKYKDDKIVNQYLAGINNLESVKPIKALINLAYKKDIMNDNEYKLECNKYIELYGDRNIEELKLESETFRTNPELLQRKIDEYRQDMDKLKKTCEGINKEKSKIKTKYHKINKLTQKAISGIKNREISRLNRSRIFGTIREIFLCFGKNFAKEKYIENYKDIFYLSMEEVFNLTKNPTDMKEIVKERKQQFKKYHLLPAYTRLIFMDKIVDKNPKTINTHIFKSQKDQLSGVPCSSGKTSGEALVIKNPKDIKDVKDKILITKMTDPGWVFLLVNAKGIISEKGSLLSHTAIISRELQIPSIVGVENLLTTVENGDIIEMDGSTGIIKIKKGEKNELC